MLWWCDAVAGPGEIYSGNAEEIVSHWPRLVINSQCLCRRELWERPHPVHKNPLIYRTLTLPSQSRWDVPFHGALLQHPGLTGHSFSLFPFLSHSFSSPLSLSFSLSLLLSPSLSHSLSVTLCLSFSHFNLILFSERCFSSKLEDVCRAMHSSHSFPHYQQSGNASPLDFEEEYGICQRRCFISKMCSQLRLMGKGGIIVAL